MTFSRKLVTGLAIFAIIAPAFAADTGTLNLGQAAFTGTSSGIVTMKPATGAAGTWTFTLPTTGGSSGQFLQTDGSGTATWATASGSGTVASSTTGQVPVYTAATTVTGSANFTISTGDLTLGASGTAGSVTMGNATSGTVKLAPVTGALGTVTASFPANTGTVAELNLAQTWTAAQALGSSTATTQSAKDNSTKLATTAYVDAPTPLTSGTSVTLSGPRQYFICTSTCTITVPVPAAGSEFCVRNGDNVATVITFAAIGSSAMYEKTTYAAYGTAGTGTAVSGGAAGDKLCLLGLDSTHYLVASFNGTWTMN